MELFWYDIRTLSEAEYEEALGAMSPERRQQVADAVNDDERRRMAGCQLLARRQLGTEPEFDAVGRIVSGPPGR